MIATKIINISNVCPTSFCRKTKNVQPNANTIGLKINFGLLNTLGIFTDHKWDI